MPGDNISLIKQKSIAGIIALTSRTFFLQIVAFFATFLLTIFLSPSTFGVFYVVSAVIAFLNYFSDIGLAAALIQKKEEISQEDLKTTFTIQQTLVGIVVIIMLLLSEPIAQFYALDVRGLWLLRVLAVSFFLSSLKTIPSVLLERKLNFNKLIIPQIAETICFYLVAVILAWQGFGIASFTYAVLVRSFIGVALMYVIAPWPIQFGLTKVSAYKLLRFGIPFQLNSFLALIKDDLLIIYLGKALPFAEVGYIGWAKKWAEVPLRLIMDSVIRVTFPAFARMQHDVGLLGKAIDKTIFGLSLTIFPITVVMIFFIESLIDLVPRYEKWQPALLSFYLFAIASAIASLSTPLTNALNAVGKIKITLWLMIIWTTTTWLLTVFFVKSIGFNGMALSLLIITLTIFLVIYYVKKITTISFITSIQAPCIAALLQAGWYFITREFDSGIPLTLLRMVSGAILYGVIILLMEKARIIDLYKQFIGVWKKSA